MIFRVSVPYSASIACARKTDKPLAQHATYLLWLDCSAIAEDSDVLSAFLRSETGLYVTAGTQYRGNGKQFLRMNVACPASRVRDGLARLKAGTEAFVRK